MNSTQICIHGETRSTSPHGKWITILKQLHAEKLFHRFIYLVVALSKEWTREKQNNTKYRNRRNDATEAWSFTIWISFRNFLVRDSQEKGWMKKLTPFCSNQFMVLLYKIKRKEEGRDRYTKRKYIKLMQRNIKQWTNEGKSNLLDCVSSFSGFPKHKGSVLLCVQSVDQKQRKMKMKLKNKVFSDKNSDGHDHDWRSIRVSYLCFSGCW